MFEQECNVFTDTPTTFNKNGVINFRLRYYAPDNKNEFTV